MAEHVDELWQPPSPDPVDQRIIRAKEQTYIQTARTVIKRPINAPEYYSRMAFDNLTEFRGTTTVAEGNEPVVFGKDIVSKMIQIFVPSNSLSALYVNFNGMFSGNSDGNIQIVAGEGRTFWIPVDRLYLAADGVNTATWRITVGY